MGNRKEYYHAWYIAHKESQLQKQREYNASHKDEKREYNQKYFAEHHEEILKANLEYNAKHREEKRAYDRARRPLRRKLDRLRQYNYLDPQYDWSQVEGYDGWTKNTDVHHRREGIGYSVKELKEQGQYYNCRPDELICVTRSEHKKIHVKIDKFLNRGNYTKKQTTIKGETNVRNQMCQRQTLCRSAGLCQGCNHKICQGTRSLD